ncbi:MAG: cysteine--tRNA ligase [Candidatus Paceibacterota bacterium]|jgi:cysteinyl-tRNA synthetase
MEIKLYNTLSKEKEVFQPIKPKQVGMYNCGPTVYDRAHIGNLRSYIFADTLRRTFEYFDYKVHQIINITDVGHLSSDADEGEDKMTKALKRENKPLTIEAMQEVGIKFFDIFVEDLKALNIKLPDEFPKASENIKEDIEIIDLLMKKGIAYQISSGICFDTSLFPTYGKLGNIDVKSLREGARIASDSEKRNPTDFLLWKSDANIGWDSPWGKGFPGWHIECSAMSRKYLGQPFDIHTGGIDHIPVHHNNEIAQSESAYDTQLSNYWMHNEFLIMNEDKMSKSKGNTITVGTLLDKRIPPLAYRYWLLTAHYRSPINFSFEALESAQNALIRLNITVSGYGGQGSIISQYKGRFEAFIGNDLDTPQAIALIWELVKDPSHSDADKKSTILDFDRVLGLNLGSALKIISDENIPEDIVTLSKEREKARNDKDWSKADILRKEIEGKGFNVIDTDSGSVIHSN